MKSLFVVFCCVFVAMTPAFGKPKAVDCSEMKLQFSDTGDYTMYCEAEYDITGGGEDGTGSSEFIDAYAKDNSHFVVGIFAAAGLRSFMSNVDTIEEFSDRILRDHGPLKAGQNMDRIETRETSARVNNADYQCVVFVKLGRREYSGYKQFSRGISCARSNIALAYDALLKFKLP